MFSVVSSNFMRRRLSAGICLLLATPFLLSAQQPKRGRKYTPPPPTCKITVTVTKAATGKPVENAGVIFHPIKDGKDDGNMELKTNEDGRAVLEVIPIGDTVRLQVIAQGYQTFGEDYQIDTDTKEIEVKLKKPARQYSIYEKHGEDQVGGTTDSSSPQEQKPPQSQTAPSQAPR